MRELLKRKTATGALSAGFIVSALCIPFLLTTTPPGTLRALRIAMLFPLAIILFQIGLAWTPLAEGRDMLRKDLPSATYLRLALAGIGLAVLGILIVDPLLARALPQYFPKSLGRLFCGLPWVALFQPLVFVVGCYAFTARLTRRPVAAVAAVILGHQGLLLLQLNDGIPVTLAAGLLIVSGAYALVLGASYRQYGYAGPAIIALISQLRHVLRFL
ncbi:MAG: hypothetical protein HN742_38315 [Lentisphaerae bacterium]|jgi:hypothetical protein|nr:hypothetical protein [Lentisphaerota bacterium]MBT5609307.1 hypothetical protein [Lentisphaerota bacterium]MBT7059399.1 hypothetical protein [Lentisphaerota bacterium]MBT7847783.1 hypothetical protein [Lentisphaerota bacterium]